jgi:hypothetical protein
MARFIACTKESVANVFNVSEDECTSFCQNLHNALAHKADEESMLQVYRHLVSTFYWKQVRESNLKVVVRVTPNPFIPRQVQQLVTIHSLEKVKTFCVYLSLRRIIQLGNPNRKLHERMYTLLRPEVRTRILLMIPQPVTIVEDSDDDFIVDSKDIIMDVYVIMVIAVLRWRELIS